MFDKLLRYYDKKLEAYNLVFKYIKVRWYFLCALLFASVFCILGIFILLETKKFQHQHFLLLIPIVSMICMFHYFNSKCKVIIKEKYSIEPEGYIWRDSFFEEKQAELLLKYLERNNLDNEDKIKYLISLTYKEADEKKYSGFIWPGVSIALLIPIWTQFASNEFKRAKNLQESLNISGYLLIISFFILICIAMLKKQ